jgi:hypothetical protein
MSESMAWLGTTFFGALAVLCGAAVALLFLGAGIWLGIGPVVLVIALFGVSGSLLAKASYMRTQRVLSDRADRLEAIEAAQSSPPAAW